MYYMYYNDCVTTIAEQYKEKKCSKYYDTAIRIYDHWITILFLYNLYGYDMTMKLNKILFDLLNFINYYYIQNFIYMYKHIYNFKQNLFVECDVGSSINYS